MDFNVRFDLVIIQEGDFSIIVISSIKLSRQCWLKRKTQFYKTSRKKEKKISTILLKSRLHCYLEYHRPDW